MMSYCPECKTEFPEETECCPNCGNLTEEVELIPRGPIYIKKSQQYEDLASSASAFLWIGVGLIIISLLCWFKVIRIPGIGSSRYLTQSMMTILGIISCVIAFTSAKSAKEVRSQVRAEKRVTRQLVNWFLEHHNGTQIDQQILQESGEMRPEEQSLERYKLIQDILITSHDITDEAFVEALAEDIYEKLYTEE